MERLKGEKKKIFYSDAGEDRFLIENKHLPEHGFFVDVGAGDGMTASNTLAFELMGWEGIAIDADPRNKDALYANRASALYGAISQHEGSRIFWKNPHTPDLSSFEPQEGGERIIVPTQRLDTLLRTRNIGKLDLLSIDTEGTELDVWRSLDWQKYQPSFVIIEYVNPKGDQSDKVRREFKHLPYKEIAQIGANLLFEFQESEMLPYRGYRVA